jgi:hypothetical protein
MTNHDLPPIPVVDDSLRANSSTDTSADTYEPAPLSPEHQAMLNELADLYRRNLITREDFDTSADFLDKLHQS